MITTPGSLMNRRRTVSSFTFKRVATSDKVQKCSSATIVTGLLALRSRIQIRRCRGTGTRPSVRPLHSSTPESTMRSIVGHRSSHVFEAVQSPACAVISCRLILPPTNQRAPGETGIGFRQPVADYSRPIESPIAQNVDDDVRPRQPERPVVLAPMAHGDDGGAVGFWRPSVMCYKTNIMTPQAVRRGTDSNHVPPIRCHSHDTASGNKP